MGGSLAWSQCHLRGTVVSASEPAAVAEADPAPPVTGPHLVTASEVGASSPAVLHPPPAVHDWAPLGRLVAAGLPVLAVLLPVAGYVVRLIGLNKPWIPSEVALYASVGEMAVVGALALAGGSPGFTFFLLMWMGRNRGIFVVPFDQWAETWRDYGPTRDRLGRLRSRTAAVLRAFLQFARRPWSVTKLRTHIRHGRARVRRYLRRPRARRRLVLAPIVAILTVVAAAGSIWLTSYWIYATFEATVGASVGSAIQAVAGYFGLWRLSRVSKQHGRVLFAALVPTIIAMLALSALGAGLNYSFAHRPAAYTFERDSAVPPGVYQATGHSEGFVYLVSCGPPPTEAVRVVALSTIVTFRPLPSFAPSKRIKIREAITDGAALQFGYRPCQ